MALLGRGLGGAAALLEQEWLENWLWDYTALLGLHFALCFTLAAEDMSSKLHVLAVLPACCRSSRHDELWNLRPEETLPSRSCFRHGVLSRQQKCMLTFYLFSPVTRQLGIILNF